MPPFFRTLFPKRKRSAVLSTTSSNNTLIDSQPHGPPTPIKAVTTTTSTRYTHHGLETETTTRTVMTYEDGRHAESPAPLPRLPPPPPTPPFNDPLPLQRNIPTIRLYLAPHPSTLRPFYAEKFYVLTGGEQVGIFREWSEVLKRTDRLGWRIVETRTNWREALELYTTAYNDGSILIEPVPGSPFANAPYVDISLPPRVAILPLNVSYPAPHEIERPANIRALYVVTKGEEAGIFPTWLQAGARIQMVRGKASWHKCDTWQEAIRSYTAAFNAGTIEVFPRPGGPFDKRASLARA